MYTKIVCTTAVVVAVVLTTIGSIVLKTGMAISNTCLVLSLTVCWLADRITR